MTENHWQHVQEIFAQALECAPEQRDALLNQACEDAAELRAEVESLLRHHDASGNDFLRPPTPPPEIAPPTTQQQCSGRAPHRPEEQCSGRAPHRPEQSQPGAAMPHQTDPLVGHEIGGYRVESVVAAGGMGTVYLAKQQQPQRLVALKLLRAGIASSSSLRRFEYEAEILARLRHPNVAEIYEAGTHLGLPYFVMEYIADAQPITEYADRHDLSARDRLELFAQVCDAVHHGHQRGIIHRDLKPANILVEAAGRVKVIDFGVARATDADIALTTLRTETGQLVGTLQYMSPEQCDADPHELDVRSDVYSLGVVLYELLCRRLPYDVTHSTLASAARVICEQPPPRPSSVTGKRTKKGGTAVSAVNAPGATGGLPASAGEATSPVIPPVKGDLERIILTALEKDRTRRYQSAADLLRDLRHYLNREPIEAKPPTLWTRSLSWVARHPAWTTTATCLTIAALVFTATWVSVWWLNAVPHRIARYDASGAEVGAGQLAKEARLFSRIGEIANWRVHDTGSITGADLIDRPDEFDGGKLAILAFGGALDSYDYGNALAAFDVGHSLDEPVWVGVPGPNEPLPESSYGPDRECKPHEFDTLIRGAWDIFPDPNHPGVEIVAIHDHGTHSQCILRIYDLCGRVLYQVWQDGGIMQCYWMADEGRLVCLGYNAEKRLDEYGWKGIDLPHPLVVFAVKPAPGETHYEFLGTSPGDGPLDPVWYHSLGPPEILGDYERPCSVRLLRPKQSDSGSAVTISLHFLGADAGVDWDIGPDGQQTPGTRVPTDRYRQNLNEFPPGHPNRLPDPSVFQLGPWPPSPGPHMPNESELP